MSKNYKNYRKLKDTVLLRFLDEIDLEDEDSLNLVLLKHLLNGELDDVYSNKYIDNLSEFEKKEILKISRDYIYLIFNSGDYRNYDESLDCPIEDDKDFLLYLLYCCPLLRPVLCPLLRPAGFRCCHQLSCFPPRNLLYRSCLYS